MITVLVVEDDEKLNYIVSVKLEEQGYRVRHCGNPMGAFDVMDSGKRWILIVSDIMMPEMDGFEFAAEVRRFDKQIPILYMTAKSDIASKRGFSLGIDDYMVKPIDLSELVMRWRPFCGGRTLPPAGNLPGGSGIE